MFQRHWTSMSSRSCVFLILHLNIFFCYFPFAAHRTEKNEQMKTPQRSSIGIKTFYWGFRLADCVTDTKLIFLYLQTPYCAHSPFKQFSTEIAGM